MEQLSNWLEAAVSAAGMTIVYNAEDWDLQTRYPGARIPDAANDPGPPAIH